MAGFDLTHRIGEVIEARALSDIEVSGDLRGGRGAVSSTTRHFNRCRLRWETGGEEFVDLAGSYSVGDRAAVIYAGGEQVSELNLNTRSYQPYQPQVSIIGGLIFAFSCAFVLVGGLGIITTPLLLWWWFSRKKARNRKLDAYVAGIR